MEPTLAPTAALEAAILNAAYMVRYYQRGGRTDISRAERARAIHKMGLIVREAFTQSSDFEPLLIALVVGLSPKDAPPF